MYFIAMTLYLGNATFLYKIKNLDEISQNFNKTFQQNELKLEVTICYYPTTPSPLKLAVYNYNQIKFQDTLMPSRKLKYTYICVLSHTHT